MSHGVFDADSGFVGKFQGNSVVPNAVLRISLDHALAQVKKFKEENELLQQENELLQDENESLQEEFQDYYMQVSFAATEQQPATAGAATKRHRDSRATPKLKATERRSALNYKPSYKNSANCTATVTLASPSNTTPRRELLS